MTDYQWRTSNSTSQQLQHCQSLCKSSVLSTQCLCLLTFEFSQYLVFHTRRSYLRLLRVRCSNCHMMRRHHKAEPPNSRYFHPCVLRFPTVGSWWIVILFGLSPTWRKIYIYIWSDIPRAIQRVEIRIGLEKHNSFPRAETKPADVCSWFLGCQKEMKKFCIHTWEKVQCLPSSDTHCEI